MFLWVNELRWKRLRSRLYSSHSCEHEAAIAAMLQIDRPRAVEVLSKALSDHPNERTRYKIIRVLKDCPDARAAVSSITMALKDQYSSVRQSAAYALGDIGDAGAGEALFAGVNDGDSYVRNACISSLQKLRWTPNNVRDALILAETTGMYGHLPQFGASVFEPLAATINTSRNKLAAMDSIAQMKHDPKMADVFAKLIGDPDEKVRKAAAGHLRSIGWGKHPAERLALAVADRNYGAIQSEVDRSAVPSLLELLNDGDHQIRQAAAEALGKMREPTCVSDLLRRLGDVQTSVRNAAIEALVQIGGPAVDPLLNALESKVGDGREWIAEALGRIGDKRAVQPLITCLERSPALGGYGAIVEALHKLGFHFKVEEKIDSAIAKGDLASIRILGSATLPHLIASLHEGHRHTRNTTVAALAALGFDSLPALPFIGALWLEGELGHDMVLRAFRDIGHASCLGYVIRYLFEHPVGAGDSRGDLRSLLVEFGPNASLRSELIELIMCASTFQHKYRGYRYDAGYITLEASDAAVRTLCGINTEIVSNILHLVAKKKDVSVTMETGCGASWTETVSFEAQRQAALAELKKRGDPPYDPDAFGGACDGSRLDAKIKSAADEEKRRRYSELLALIRNPRGEYGENKWTYYRELAENYRTAEVFRLLAADLAGYHTISPSDLSGLVGMLIKTGQSLSDREVQSGLSGVKGPWPLAYSEVIAGIKRARAASQGRH